MNSVVHANISCKRYKTTDPEDFNVFEKAHSFMDCSKEVESSNLHRCLTHHLWFVRRVFIPIHGHSYLTKGSNQMVNWKDCLESDHLCADNRGKFIATLSDYFSLMSDDKDDEQRFRDFRSDNAFLFAECPEIEELLLSPLYNTGLVRSLWLTHNSWFIGTILPMFMPVARGIRNYSENAPSIMFGRMRYADWVQNGRGAPPSFSKIQDYRNKSSPPNQTLTVD